MEPVGVEDREDIGFHQARFSWMNELPSQRTFLLHVDEELIFRKNSINLVIGPTGSGKTSLLMALLGECSLSRTGAYEFDCGQVKCTSCLPILPRGLTYHERAALPMPLKSLGS